VLNIGNQQPVALMDYVNALEQALGKTALKNYMPMQMGDVPATSSDTRELAALTGFCPPDHRAARRCAVRGLVPELLPKQQNNRGGAVTANTLLQDATVAVVGLGYVGLPLAVEFGKKFNTIGFDLSQSKIDAYRRFEDPSGELTSAELQSASRLRVTTDPSELAAADYIVVAVPTPIDSARQPDFGPLIGASESVGRHMKRGAIVVYESTVYPGATEELCVPVLERESGMRWRTDFNVGYSPERINPGDKEHSLTRIVKVVSGDDAATLERVAALYGAVVTAGLHRASSIRVAEAAKVIENTQRDLNIALINELALIFDRLGIDTTEVLEAAGTKWNFLKFRPGLVGGHCIGVDPYYLTHKAEMVGYQPQVILAGRRINDGMGKFIAEKTIKLMINSGLSIKGAVVNVLGLTFKEDCPDLRNSRVPDIIAELKTFGVQVNVHDPVAEADQARHEYGIDLKPWEALPKAQAVIVAVAHHAYQAMPPADMAAMVARDGVVIDVKACLNQSHLASAAGGPLNYWRL
jgi:UDP-N-acetyl-D-galactosamine dehydrogenase